MKRVDVEKMLKGASVNLAPDIYDRIANEPVVVEPIAEEMPLKGGLSLRRLAIIFSIILVFLVIGGSASFIGLYTAEAERVYIDINPSVEVVVNYFDRVIKVNNNNEDAAAILATIQTKGVRLNDFVDNFIVEANNKGYIEEDGAIFISVASNRTRQAEQKTAELGTLAQNIIAQKNLPAVIESQNVSDVNRKEAQDNNISVGKLKVIQNIIAMDNSYSIDELKDLDMRELKTILDNERDNTSNSNNPNNSITNPNQHPSQGNR